MALSRWNGLPVVDNLTRMQARRFPLAGILIAIATTAVVAMAGSSVSLALVVLVVWVASFWLMAPPPPARPPRQNEGPSLSPSAMAGLFEHSGLPMIMTDEERIVVANEAAREALGNHIVGQDARVAFRHPAAVALLSQSGGGTASIDGLTGPRSSWRMTRQPIDARYSLIELVNRTAETDVGRAHTDFVANASHELRTPLASIIGYMETLADADEEIDEARRSLFHATVLREARRLESLVDDLMSLSRIEAEKHDKPREPIDLALLLQQASRDGAGTDRQPRLEFRLDPGKHTVRGDRNQLEQLIRNLVDNALKYGAADSKVTVAMKPNDRGMAVITVRDRGEGIAPEHVPHLTRRFYRTDPGRSRAAGGTGLGLAIVKHIVERHRGLLDIASRVGEGTTVTVALPLVD
jgi:two-component system phosphate regulon sensor histidine kinase PhoR